MLAQKVAVIAGKGKLPVIWVDKVKNRVKEIYVFSLYNDNISYFKENTKKVYPADIGQLGQIIDLLQKNNIKKLILLGNIKKTDILEQFKPDQEMKKLLKGLETAGDYFMVDFFKEKGIEILEQTTYLDSLIPGPGLLTSIQPSRELLIDMEYGFNMAQKIGKLDIGQTVIVENKKVLAVEAMEGTDAAIKRGGELGQKGIIMAKVCRAEQDLSFDIPTVGMKTMKNLIEVKARGLVFEANKTIFLEKERFIKAAEKANITIMGIKED